MAGARTDEGVSGNLLVLAGASRARVGARSLVPPDEALELLDGLRSTLADGIRVEARQQIERRVEVLPPVLDLGLGTVAPDERPRALCPAPPKSFPLCPPERYEVLGPDERDGERRIEIVPGVDEIVPAGTGIVEAGGEQWASTALKRDGRYLAYVAEHPGARVDDIREGLGLPRAAQGEVALAMKDARLEGLIHTDETTGQHRYFVNESGLGRLGVPATKWRDALLPLHDVLAAAVSDGGR